MANKHDDLLIVENLTMEFVGVKRFFCRKIHSPADHLNCAVVP